MTAKQRIYLKGLTMKMNSIFQIGKSNVAPELTTAIAGALGVRKPIKLSVLESCMDDDCSIAEVLAERIHSEMVQVAGKKIILYKQAKNKNKQKITFP